VRQRDQGLGRQLAAGRREVADRGGSIAERGALASSAADTSGTFRHQCAYDGRAAHRLRNILTALTGARRDESCAGESIARVERIARHHTLISRSGKGAGDEGFRDVSDPPRRPVPLTALSTRADRRDHHLASASEPTAGDRAAKSGGSADRPVRRLGGGVGVVANAYANGAHEQRVAAMLRARCPELYVTAGTELSREWYEYERSSTAAANAYVGPALRDYIGRLDRALRSGGFERTFYLMASNGGVFSVERAERQPIMLVESGPVGGSIGAGVVATELGFAKAIAFDMGGTTAKCAVLEDGRFEVKSPYYVGGTERGFPIRGGVLDIVEVGTGGGSIAWLDDQGRLAVGAQRRILAWPGLLRCGRPTINDANLSSGESGLPSAGDDLTPRPKRHGASHRMAGTSEQMARALTSPLSMAMAIKRAIRRIAMIALSFRQRRTAAHVSLRAKVFQVIVARPGVFSALGMLADARADEHDVS
jgi:N-methylhydantoinase A